jgi:hypothetical protein
VYKLWSSSLCSFFQPPVTSYLFGQNIVTYMGLAWRIIMGSRFDDSKYWHFFTITVNHNSSHIKLLNDVCLTNLSRISHCFLTLEFTNELSFISSKRPEFKSYFLTVPLFCCVVTRNVCLIPKQRSGFLNVYNFQFPNPWTSCFVISSQNQSLRGNMFAHSFPWNGPHVTIFFSATCSQTSFP